MYKPVRGDWWQRSFKEIHDIDYNETFSLVAMPKSIQILLTIVAFYDYEI